MTQLSLTWPVQALDATGDDARSRLETPERLAEVRLQKRFSQIKARCKRHPAYRNVGFEFVSSTEAAKRVLARLGPLPPEMTIDRVDPRGPYSIDNIRYADRLMQSVNRVIVLEGWRKIPRLNHG